MGGATFPVSDLASAAHIGFNAGALVEFTSPRTPLGYRIDLQYQRLSGKEFELAGNDERLTDFRYIDLTANAQLRFPVSKGTSFYLIAGPGVYQEHAKDEDSNGTHVATKFGLNGGGGFRFATGTRAIFIEARDHYIVHGSQINTFRLHGTAVHAMQIAPLSIGITF